MKATEAARTLQDIERLQSKTRADLRSFWFPLVLFGTLSLLAAGVVMVAGGPVQGIFWMVAGPGGGALTAWHYSRRERRLGVRGPAAPFIMVGIGIMAGAFGAGALGSMLGADIVSAVGPPVMVSIGYLVFAWLERSPLLAACAAGLGALAVGLGVINPGPEHAALILALAFGIVLLTTGAFLRLTERESA